MIWGDLKQQIMTWMTWWLWKAIEIHFLTLIIIHIDLESGLLEKWLLHRHAVCEHLGLSAGVQRTFKHHFAIYNPHVKHMFYLKVNYETDHSYDSYTRTYMCLYIYICVYVYIYIILCMRVFLYMYMLRCTNVMWCHVRQCNVMNAM